MPKPSTGDRMSDARSSKSDDAARGIPDSDQGSNRFSRSSGSAESRAIFKMIRFTAGGLAKDLGCAKFVLSFGCAHSSTGQSIRLRI